MLELTLAFEAILGKLAEALIILVLLSFNALLSFSEQNRASKALEQLKERLRIDARVMRDNTWQTIPASNLVPGDLVHVRGGDIVPADISLSDGEVEIDQSTLTGESTPVERGRQDLIYSASVVRRGEATGTVKATGAASYFGKTAELVRTAGAKSHLEALVFSIVRYLVAMDVLLVVAIIAYARLNSLPLAEVLPFALILLVASVPVALPATFTLATALASLGLAQRGVLVTRLGAIEEAAAMSVICSDKTGTLTQNRLTLTAVQPWPGHSEDELLQMAAVASDAATQDPIDIAILTAANDHAITQESRVDFIAFDPSSKRSEAHFIRGSTTWHTLKGAPQVVAAISFCQDSQEATERLAASGARVIGVAAGPKGSETFLGLIALSDPIRPGAPEVLGKLLDLGIQVRMVTGDTAATAASVAKALGLAGAVCTERPLDPGCAIYAGVFPEDKFELVKTLQDSGHVVGMTGDGVNDAPALKQAEVGIAVQAATDVAKAAASLVLTTPGLGGVIDAVITGRSVYQRMLTYTINKIVKTFQVALFLSLGLLFLHTFVISPLLVLLLLFANDFVTMSLATDNVHPSAGPDRWNVGTLVISSAVIAMAWLVYIFAVRIFGQWWAMNQGTLQATAFVGLVYSGLANVLLVRSRGHMFSSRPGRALLLAGTVDVVTVTVMAHFGIFMTALPWQFLGYILAGTAIYVGILDQIKVPLLRHLEGR